MPFSVGDVNFFRRYFRRRLDVFLYFEYTGATRLRDILGYARKYNKKPKWLPPSVWNDMLKHWSDDDKFKKLSQQNKKNRLSNVEGFDPSLHTCGSIPISERKRRLVNNELY